WRESHVVNARLLYFRHDLPRLAADAELRWLALGGIRADPDPHVGRLHSELLLRIPQRQRFGAELEAHAFGFPGRQRDALESGQRAYRLRDAGAAERHVKSHGLDAGTRAGVRDIGAGGQHGLARTRWSRSAMQ